MADHDWTPNFGGIGRDAPTWAAKRPLRIALLGDFGGGALAGRLDVGAALAKRKPLKVEFDTLEDALARLDLTLTLPIGADGAAVQVPVTELESFHPDELYRNLPVFAELAGLRKRLNAPANFAKAAAEVQAWGGGVAKRKASRVSRGKSGGGGGAFDAGAKLDDFARLTGRVPASASAAATADTGLQSLLKQIVGPFVVAAPNPQKDKLVASVDAALSDAMRAVLQQADFQNAESLWRGVDFLLRRLETSHQLQVHLFDISAEEFAADLSQVQDLGDGGLYQLLVEQPSQDPDGGYAWIGGCYRFDATPPQAELLGRAARVAAHAGAPFISAIATDAFTDRREPPHRLVTQAFQALRDLPDASYLALIGPRFLLRHPYGKKSDPIQSFAFEEFTRDGGLRGMLWGHPALLALSVLATPGGQLAIADLPFHHYVDADGDTLALPCTERLVNTQAAALLRDVGINAVMAHKGEPLVKLSGLSALNDDGLAAPGSGGARKKPADSRFAIQGRIDTEKKDGAGTWAPAERRAAGAAASGAATAATAADEAESSPEADDRDDETASTDDAETGRAAPADGAEADTTDSELDALLASLSNDAEPAAAAAPAAADADAAAASDDDGMDPELAALLKSLG